MSDDATVKFGYDGRNLYAGMGTLEGKLKRHAGNLESVFQRTGKGINRALESAISLKGAIFAGAAAGMVHYAKSTLETYDLVASESKKLNTSAETLQRIGEAAEILGNTDLESLSKGLIKLRKNIIDEPAGELAQGLEEAGIKANDFLRLDADEQLLSLADAFEKASAKGNALPLLTGAMGKGFSELIPLLSAGRGELKGFMDDAFVMSNGAVRAMDNLNDKLDEGAKRVGTAMKAVAFAGLKGVYEMAGDLGRKTGLFDLGEHSQRSGLDHDGSKAAAKDAEAAAENKKKRDAEADAAAKKAAKIQRDIQKARDWEVETRRQGLKIARDELTIQELELAGMDREAKKLKEQSFIEKRAHEYSAAGMDHHEAIANAQREWAMLAAKQAQEEKKRAQSERDRISSMRENLAWEKKSVDLLEAQSKGQSRKVQKLQDEAFLRDRIKKYEAAGQDPYTAENEARRELKAKKNLEKYEQTGRAHIGGVKKYKNRNGGDFFKEDDSGLNQFYRNQERTWESSISETPAAGYKRGHGHHTYDAFGRDKRGATSAQRSGHYMGSGSWNGFSHADVERNAKKQIAANSNADLGTKLDKIAENTGKMAEEFT